MASLIQAGVGIVATLVSLAVLTDLHHVALPKPSAWLSAAWCRPRPALPHAIARSRPRPPAAKRQGAPNPAPPRLPRATAEPLADLIAPWALVLLGASSASTASLPVKGARLPPPLPTLQRSRSHAHSRRASPPP